MFKIRRYRSNLVAMLALALAALLVLSLACGGGDDDDDGGTGTAAPTSPAGNGDGDGEVTFDVSMGDNFFEPAEFTVEAGAHVTFNLTNDGAAIHNMRVAGSDDKYNTGDDAVSDPDLISGGGTATLEWDAPSEAGEYIFQCDFHPTDMKGTITVE